MPTKALKAKSTAKISRAVSGDTSCPVLRIMREVASCRRLQRTSRLTTAIEKLPRRLQSEMTPQYTARLIGRRIRALEALAHQLQPTSKLGAAYQLLIALNLATLDDYIDAAVDPVRLGDADRLREQADMVRQTILSAYLALRTGLHDRDLTEVERPHLLEGWKPSKTIQALIDAETEHTRS
ncbi:MAG: hypothetical protein R3C52_10445 [Hyphomonadaceae bacterium]